MEISKDRIRTVAVGMGYPEESPYRKYEIYYLVSNKYQAGEAFNTFDEAFHAAIRFADALCADDSIDVEQRKSMLKSLMVFDTLEEREVTTVKLHNYMLDIVRTL